jgi:hypothetical protein
MGELQWDEYSNGAIALPDNPQPPAKRLRASLIRLKTDRCPQGWRFARGSMRIGSQQGL